MADPAPHGSPLGHVAASWLAWTVSRYGTISGVVVTTTLAVECLPGITLAG
jgi:hypothetical protein